MGDSGGNVTIAFSGETYNFRKVRDHRTKSIRVFNVTRTRGYIYVREEYGGGCIDSLQ